MASINPSVDLSLQGDVALVCQEEVLAMPSPQFRRVEISVFQPLPDGSGVGHRVARLVGFATALQ